MEPMLEGYGDEVIYSPTTCVMDTPIALKTLTDSLPSNTEIVYGASLSNAKRVGEVTNCEIKTIDSGDQTIESKLKPVRRPLINKRPRKPPGPKGKKPSKKGFSHGFLI